MGSYLVWPAIGFAVVVGITFMLFVPGLWLFGVATLAVLLVAGIVLGIGAAGRRAAAGTTTRDVVERRSAHEERRRGRRAHDEHRRGRRAR